MVPAKIAIVDDDPSVLESLSDWLGSRGLEARTFGSAKAFLEAGYVREVDLLVSDIRMPEMDGFEVLRLLRSNDAYATIPVIIVSAKDLDAQEHEWLMGRAQGVIAKRQLSEAEFLQHIQRVFA